MSGYIKNPTTCSDSTLTADAYFAIRNNAMLPQSHNHKGSGNIVQRGLPCPLAGRAVIAVYRTARSGVSICNYWPRGV